MQTYARQGGSSAIFIHDDGLQLVSEKDREARIAFYADHNIGWVARPAHSSAPDGFKRAGRFKKASNLNYGLALSMKLERHLRVLQEAEEREELDETDDTPLEDRALHLACDEMFAETGGQWKPWANNGRSIRIGEIILLVDADTVVPEDCLRDAARELAESPEVAIIQHESGKTIHDRCLVNRRCSTTLFPQRSCRLPIITLRMESHILRAESTNVSLWVVQTARWPLSWVTMHSFAGRHFRMPRSLILLMGKRRFGQSPMCPRTLIWLYVFRYVL